MFKKVFIILILTISVTSFSLSNPFKNEEYSCKDLDPDCPSRKVFCDHEAYKAIMHLKCSMTCNACEEVSKMIEEMEAEETGEGDNKLPWTHGGSKENEIEEEEQEQVEEENEDVTDETPENEVTEEEQTHPTEEPEISENVDEEIVTSEPDIETIQEEEEVTEKPVVVEAKKIVPTLTPKTEVAKVALGPWSKYATRQTQKAGSIIKPKMSITERIIQQEIEKRCVDDGKDCLASKDLCTSITYGEIIRKSCMKTCGVCTVKSMSTSEYKPLVDKPLKRGNDYYKTWIKNMATSPKPVIITVDDVRKASLKLNALNKKTVTKPVASPRRGSPIGESNIRSSENIIRGRPSNIKLPSGGERFPGGRGPNPYAVRGSPQAPQCIDIGVDCVNKQALCNNKNYHNVMEKMCKRSCGWCS
uniref:ShKT domain-containing protein n=1 Tax=Rhabditophanes sp. KR3021 TaxID=114890 RepID=A0AC35UG78_9BILA